MRAASPYRINRFVAALTFSSGDLVADRRADYARMLADSGDFAAAAGLMRDTLALVPGWAAGWYRLGEMLAAAGEATTAADAWRESLRLDPLDRCGAAMKLELAGHAHGIDGASSGFVETLFDQYAPRFDAELVGKLGYRVPEMIEAAILATGRERFAHAVDLGCGTGLMGERLRRRVSHLEGHDISAGMLARAREKGLYDRLERSDLLLLSPAGITADLVTAADVLIYFGDLSRILRTVAAMLVADGLFSFSVELHSGEGDFALRESRRYAHAPAYIRRLLEEAGFEIVSINREALRMDRGEPIDGLVVVARRRTVTTAPMLVLTEEPAANGIAPIVLN
jgi:predicted TPR repeat methyltransferase